MLAAARTLWDYHRMNQPLQRSDGILALGSHDLRVAERAAQLYLDGWAPRLILSGGLGALTRDLFDRPEADKFAEIAVRMGVLPQDILVENRSSNTGENIHFTRQLLAEKQVQIRSLIVVQKPYMERRSYATLRKVWPEIEVTVTSPQIAFEDYPTAAIPLETTVHIMVGDLQRILIYPGRGFQVAQDVPPEVMTAYHRLIELGFTNHLAQG